MRHLGLPIVVLASIASSVIFSSGCSSGSDAGGEPGKKYVFTTSATYGPDLKAAAGAATGLEGGDRLCTLAASAAGLGGTWKAWLSDATTNAIDRIVDVGPLSLIDGTKVFNNRDNLATTPIVPINENENGSPVTSVWPCAWTNTAVGGAKYSACNWDSVTPCGGPHTYGLRGLNSNEWTVSDSSGYFQQCHLYCIQQ